MPEIGMSGSMSGDGKRGVAEWLKLPRPSSTLPKPTCRGAMTMSAFESRTDVPREPGYFRDWTRSGHWVAAAGGRKSNRLGGTKPGS